MFCALDITTTESTMQNKLPRYLTGNNMLDNSPNHTASIAQFKAYYIKSIMVVEANQYPK